MKRLHRLGLCAAAVTALAAGAQADKADRYTAGVFHHEGITLPYRLLEVHADQPGHTLLVIQLHGGSARGDDNLAQLDAPAVDSVENYLTHQQRKAFFLLPQCPADRLWNESTRAYSVVMTDVLAALIGHLADSLGIDANHSYLTGYSAGGSGTWRILNDNSDMFAAALVAAANPLMVNAEQVARTPVYAVAGSADRIMSATKIEAFVNDIIALGGNAQFDLLADTDHFGTCAAAFSSARLDWLLAHPADNGTVFGDVTGDNFVDVNDINVLINIILGVTEFNTRADLDGDGLATVGDINAVVNIILGL